MLVHLVDILPEGIKVELDLDSEDPALHGLGAKGPVKGALDINKTGHQVLVRGRIKGEVQMACARCLKDFILGIEENVDIELRPASDLEKTAPDRELGSDDLDVEFFRGDTLDIGHLVAEQISLAIPMKPLCSHDCGGLCPDCGADRSRNACRCEPDTDPRWSALRELKLKITERK